MSEEEDGSAGAGLLTVQCSTVHQGEAVAAAVTVARKGRQSRN